jgi:hypothetical protein
VSGVDLGSWTVDELRAAGFDEVGVVQPLLRPGPPVDAEPLRRDLEARGALVLQDGRWTPRGDLGVVLATRARARLVVVVRGAREGLLLGRFAGGDGLLEVTEQDGRCSCSLRTRNAVVDDLLAALLLGVADGEDGPPLRPGNPGWEVVEDAASPRLALEALRADDPDRPPVQVQLTVVAAADGARLVLGHREGEQAGVTARGASHATVRTAVRAVLVGEVP